MTGRIHALALFFALALFLLGLRAWQLQVLEYERYALRSQGNYLKTEDIPAPRGKRGERESRSAAWDQRVARLVYIAVVAAS